MIKFLLSLAYFTCFLAGLTLAQTNASNWKKISDGPYSKREGLMGVSFKGFIFLSGGREVSRLGCGWEMDYLLEL